VYKSAMHLAELLMARVEGPQWPVAEVRGLLARSAQAAALCKAWYPGDVKQQLADVQQHLKAAVARGRPGQARLPAAAQFNPNPRALKGGPPACCACCGQPSLKLRKCSACKVAQYCSRECQAKHWKEGGHRRECAALAAAGSRA
jgi:hypothetical protein